MCLDATHHKPADSVCFAKTNHAFLDCQQVSAPGASGWRAQRAAGRPRERPRRQPRTRRSARRERRMHVPTNERALRKTSGIRASSCIDASVRTIRGGARATRRKDSGSGRRRLPFRFLTEMETHASRTPSDAPVARRTTETAQLFGTFPAAVAPWNRRDRGRRNRCGRSARVARARPDQAIAVASASTKRPMSASDLVSVQHTSNASAA